MSGIAFVVLTNFHHNVLRWKRNEEIRACIVNLATAKIAS